MHYEVDYDHSPRYFERRLRGAARGFACDPPARRRAGRRLYFGRPRFQPDRASSPARGRSAQSARLPRPLHRLSGLRRKPLRRGGRRQRPTSTLHVTDITAGDFRDNIGDVIYHLDFPVAGPGSFPQYMVSALAAKHRQGRARRAGWRRDLRRLCALPDRLFRAMHQGGDRRDLQERQLRRHASKSIVPQSRLLREYKPMIQEFWREGLFEDLDRALFPPDRPLDRHGGRGGLEPARQGARLRALPAPSSTPRATSRKEAYFD